MKEKIEMLKDANAVISFAPDEELKFLGMLDYLEDNDVWENVNIKSLHLNHVSEAISPIELSLTVNGKEYPVLEDALYSIKRRAENCSRILKVMSSEDLAAVLNMSWKYIEKFRENNQKGKAVPVGTALIRGGNVLAVHSSRYVPFIQRAIYGKFGHYLNDEYEEANFKYAVYQHHLTEAAYDIVSEKVVDGYCRALNDAGYKIASDDIQIVATLRTSDNGMSSVSIHPTLSIKNKSHIPFALPIKVEHKDGAKFQEVTDAIEKVFSHIEDATEHMKELLKIELVNPKSLAVRLTRKKGFNLPITPVKELSPQFEWYENTHTKMTAHDFYITICEILYSPHMDDLSEDRKLAIRDALSKILCLKEHEWDELDVPGADW